MNMYNIIVKKIYLGFVILLVFTFSISKSLACDLLSINIGSNKSSIENIFGKIDDTELTISQTETTRSGETNIGGEVSVYMSSKDAFCNEIDFGEVLIKGYVVNNKVGALAIEVQNGPDNEQSNQGLLNQYVQANFGSVDTNDKDWPGYKFWDIDGQRIFYYKIKNTIGEIQEGVAVTSSKYFEVLLDSED